MGPAQGGPSYGFCTGWSLLWVLRRVVPPMGPAQGGPSYGMVPPMGPAQGGPLYGFRVVPPMGPAGLNTGLSSLTVQQ